MLSFGLRNSIWISLVSLYTTCPELRQPVPSRTEQNSSCYDVSQPRGDAAEVMQVTEFVSNNSCAFPNIYPC